MKVPVARSMPTVRKMREKIKPTRDSVAESDDPFDNFLTTGAQDRTLHAQT